MGSALANGVNTPYGTREGLIKTSDNAAMTATIKNIGDGAGNDSGLYLGINKVGFGEAVAMTKTSTEINNTVAKVAYISVTQNVDLDTIETNSNASKTKTDFLTVTGAVNLDTINANYLSTSTAASTYLTQANAASTYQPIMGGDDNYVTDAEKTKIGYISVTQAVDLDAIESRVNELDASVILKGTWDASSGSFPGGGVAQAGWSYIVSVGGTVNGVVFTANDRIIAITDNASTSTYASNWHKADYTDAVLSVDGLTGAVSLSSTYQGLNSNLTTLAGLTATTNNFIVSVAGAWASRTPTQVKTTLSLDAVENTALSTWAGTANITTLGTVTTGTWNANAIDYSKGGSGLTSFTALSIAVTNTANTRTQIAPSAGQSVRINAGGTAWEAYTPGSGGASALSDITAATGNKTINNASNAIEWQWNSFVGGTGVYALKISSSSTAETNTSHASAQGVFGINLTGANAASNVVTKAAYISNVKTGTGAVNYGLHITTSGSASQLSNPLMIEGHAGGGLIFGSGSTSTSGLIWSSGVTPTSSNYAFEVLSGGGTSLNSTSTINIRFNSSSSTGGVFTTSGFTINNKLTLVPAAGSGTGLSVTPANNLGTSTFAGISFNGTHAATSAQSSYYRPINITYTINNTGTASTATATGIFLNATETALNSMVHNLMNLGVGGVSQLLLTNAGVLTVTGSINTGAPSGGTAAAWKLGTVASVSPTSPNRTIEVEVGGTTYYIHAKTTNN